MKQKIAVITGPNLNLLGKRDPDIYGTETLDNIITNVEAYAQQARYELDAMQSNSEGELVDAVQRAGAECVGAIINAAAYSHTSIALRDAVQDARIPFIEVHISNIYAREEFRQHSYISEVATGVICGLGGQGYILAFGALLQLIKNGE